MVMLKEVSRDEKRIEIESCVQFDTQREFERQFEQLIPGSQNTITLDLSRLGNINPFTMEKILRLEQKVMLLGKNLRIEGCSASVYSAFRALKVDSFIPIFQHSHEAVGGFM